jgi:hypothetical protein
MNTFPGQAGYRTPLTTTRPPPSKIYSDSTMVLGGECLGIHREFADRSLAAMFEVRAFRTR